MGYRRTTFAPGEAYHCYTRGIDKRITFADDTDRERFLQALYVCNDTHGFHRGSLTNTTHEGILNSKKGEPLVAILAYCLMPNHYHLILHEIVEGGITRFMQKVGTLYTMYFNARNERIGSLFVKPFRSKHIDDDSYLRKVVQYVHLNPAELFEPGWKEGIVRNLPLLQNKLEMYRFSSLPDYLNPNARLESNIIDHTLARNLMGDTHSLSSVLDDTQRYYADLKW